MATSRRTLIARIAAAERWAKEPDRTKATAAARRGLEEKFERLVDPDGVLPPDELAKRVASAKTAHYSRMALAKRNRPARRRAA
jgi:hypothetical protein